MVNYERLKGLIAASFTPLSNDEYALLRKQLSELGII
jgi:hypothetical protein